jgi:hypothetical protein
MNAEATENTRHVIQPSKILGFGGRSIDQAISPNSNPSSEAQRTFLEEKLEIKSICHRRLRPNVCPPALHR